MTAAGWGQLIALIVVIAVTAPLLGRYMARVLDGAPSRLDRLFGRAGNDRLLGLPEADSIVVNFLGGWNLDQPDAASTPITFRLDPA